MEDMDEVRAQLWGSFLLFTRTFFPIVTGREFNISSPVGRESHFITIARELTKVSRLETNNLLINVPPGHGKSVMLSMWTAWNLSRYPDSQFLYISYGHDLAAKHTEFIKRVISCAHYKDVFDVHIRHDSKAKDYFRTTAGGTVKAFGSAAGIVGHDAGLPNLDRFSGSVICDDLHKIDEAHSSTIRQKVIENYRETIVQRPRGPNVPIVFIGQRVHEDDIAAFMLSGNDERKWDKVILKGIDDAGNALYPEVNPLPQLQEKQDKNPYVFYSQYQQEPVPSGGSLFKPEWFVSLDDEPEILMTFITADTAETSKSYNDATVFGFWGVYEIETMGRKIGEHGLHWLDCTEIRVEPRDLKDEFLDFWQECMRHKHPPMLAAIEKKSTGTTLCSVLQDIRGMQIRNIERTRASGSKTQRFLEIQPYVASRRVSFTAGARHRDLCVTHMSKITASDSHRHDDICDVLADAIKIALIDKTLVLDTKQDTTKAATIMQKQKSMLRTRSNLYGGNQ
jgi:predicted phage terminase large subunit-like protein